MTSNQKASASRKKSKATIIAITGSSGKAITREITAALFSVLGKTHALEGKLTQPDDAAAALAAMPQDAACGIFEIGIKQPDSMVAIAREIRPAIVIITSVEHDPRMSGTLDSIIDAYADIFSSMDKSGGAVINHDNPYFERLAAAAQKQGLGHIIGFGEDDGAHAKLIDCTLHSDSSKVTADILGERVKYKIGTPGQHIVLLSLAALAAVKASGGNLQKSVDAFKTPSATIGRGNIFEIMIAPDTLPVTIIDESQNADPESMQAAFQTLETAVPAGNGRRLAVLGDMLELGRDGPMLHAGLANTLLKSRTDRLFCCGQLMDALYQALPPDWRGAHTKDSKALAEELLPAILPGDVVLVKGSHGSKMSYIIEALRTLNRKDSRHAV